MFDVSFWWRISFSVDTVSCDPMHEFKLDICQCRRKGHGIAAISARREVKNENLLKLVCDQYAA